MLMLNNVLFDDYGGVYHSLMFRAMGLCSLHLPLPPDFSNLMITSCTPNSINDAPIAIYS